MKDMKKDSFRSILEGIPLATLGSLIFAVAVAFFYDPAKLAPGGISGLAVIISHVTKLPTGTLIFVMNIPLLILAQPFCNSTRPYWLPFGQTRQPVAARSGWAGPQPYKIFGTRSALRAA